MLFSFSIYNSSARVFAWKWWSLVLLHYHLSVVKHELASCESVGIVSDLLAWKSPDQSCSPGATDISDSRASEGIEHVTLRSDIARCIAGRNGLPALVSDVDLGTCASINA